MEFTAIKNITFSPVNECIYCGEISGLTDEHTWPEGLLGTCVLPKATCKNCQDITSAIERIVLRDQLGPYRKFLEIKGKKKRHRNPSLRRRVVKLIDGILKEETEEIAIDEIPVKAIIPIFTHYAGKLLKTDYPSDLEMDINYHIKFDSNMLKESQSVATYESVTVFARFLAKVSHAHAVSQIGINGFKPFLTDLILGKETNWPNFVGMACVNKEEIVDIGNGMAIFSVKDSNLLFSRIAFFEAGFGATYDVAVGEFLN